MPVTRGNLPSQALGEHAGIGARCEQVVEARLLFAGNDAHGAVVDASDLLLHAGQRAEMTSPQ